MDKYFYNKCNGKMYNAINAMIVGLEEFDKKDSFKVDMNTFGYSERGVCFGCAAVCCVQKLGNIEFSSGEIYLIGRLRKLDIELDELKSFERSIDMLRSGNLYYILRYFNITNRFKIMILKCVKLKTLYNYTWRRDIKYYKRLYKVCKFLNI